MLFLMQNSEIQNYKKVKIANSNKLKFNLKNQTKIVSFQNETGSKFNLNQNFITLAPVYGFVLVLNLNSILTQKKWLGLSTKKLSQNQESYATTDSNWNEKFFVLSNIGLIIMEKPSDTKFQMYEFNEFRIIPVSDQKY